MSKVSTVTHKALEVARAVALEVSHVGQDGPTRFAFKRSYCRLWSTCCARLIDLVVLLEDVTQGLNLVPKLRP
jgi:hypothetical protein